jgi:hypothetical protein
MYLRKSVSNNVTPLFNMAQMQSTEEELIERRILLRTMKNTSSNMELDK